jgi:hypothetical protein
MQNKLGLTAEGQEWLIGVIDPYHDTPLDICGLPDGNTAPVATQVVKNSYNLQCPGGITTGTWDVMIVMTPFAKPIKFANQSRLGGTNSNPTNEVVTISTGVTNVTLGAMTNIIGPSGVNFNLSSSITSANVSTTSFGLADQYLQGKSRIIGKGFEVHNTTSDLNIQGMCTTFQVPIPDLGEACEMNTYNVNQAALPNTIGSSAQGSVLPIEMWPSSQSQAVLTPGSRQWTAKQGAYMVPKLSNLVIPATDTGFAISPFLVGADSSNASQNLATATNPSTVATNVSSFQNVFWDNFDMVGCIFSGLSLQTTLTVNYTYIIERQPDYTISDLVVLARPPPERDNVALDLYTHLSDHLPIGVPVAENGLGDWFANALSTAADFVAPVLSAVPGIGGVIGSAINTVNTAYKAGKQPKVVEVKKFETNPYVKPPVERPLKSYYQGPSSTNKVVRVAVRNINATNKLKQRNIKAAEKRAVKAVVKAEMNPFKGRSIPR